MTDKILRIYLEPPMLKTAIAGTFNFMNVLREAVEEASWRVEWHEACPKALRDAPSLPGYALFHMEMPLHDRALCFRRAYHYPFWQIEPMPQRWRFRVATSRFAPEDIDPDEAQVFLTRIRHRVLPGPEPTAGETVLVPLQGKIRKWRSFQVMRPIDMVKEVAQTGRKTIVTLHPREIYDQADHAALTRLEARFPNLTIGGQSTSLLRECAFVATQNSAVAFDGLLLKKPVILFGQSDFHHIALNVADLGAKQAISCAFQHRPDFARYVFWFLRVMAINATAPDAKAQVRTAMKRGGWPI